MALIEKKSNLRQRLPWVPEVFSLLFAAKIEQQEKKPSGNKGRQRRSPVSNKASDAFFIFLLIYNKIVLSKPFLYEKFITFSN